jgi:hypothetical protein
MADSLSFVVDAMYEDDAPRCGFLPSGELGVASDWKPIEAVKPFDQVHAGDEVRKAEKMKRHHPALE